MKLTLIRTYKSPQYTIGKLYIEGTYFCDTLEDPDRGLNDSLSLQEIQKLKVYGDTAIPIGTYKFNIDVISPKFQYRSWAKPCGGKLPRLENVKGYEGVLIHVGNTAKDTLGCILVGQNKVKGQVINSTNTFLELYKRIKKAYNNKEELSITIKY